jgi:hypothetical protein
MKQNKKTDSNTVCQSAVCDVEFVPQTVYSKENPLPSGYRWKGWIEGPRRACLPQFLKKLAQRLNVEIVLDTHQRIIRETVFFEITGTEDNVNEFQTEVCESVAESKN